MEVIFGASHTVTHFANGNVLEQQDTDSEAQAFLRRLLASI